MNKSAVLRVVDDPAARLGHLGVRRARHCRMSGLAPLGFDRLAHRVRARGTEKWKDISRDSHRR